MGAALDNGGGGDQRQLGLLTQLRDRQRTAVAHGGTDLSQRGGHAVCQSASIGHIGVHALLKAQLCGAAQIVALPVPGAGATLAPIFLHIAAAHKDLAGGRLVKPGEIPAQHAEISAHGQSQRDVIVLHDAAVGADGHIDASLLKILIPLGGHVDNCGSLSATDALGLTGDADGTAADADLYEVGSGIGQKAEALAVHHVAGANLHGIAVLGADPLQAVLLPIGIALGGVHYQHVHTGLHQCGDTLLVVTGVDARAHHIALLAVQQLQGVALVGIIILAEHKAHQMAVLGNNGQGVELVIPDDVIGRFQAGALRCVDELLHRRHEIRHLGVGVHAADPVIPAGDQTQHLAGTGAVIRDSHGGVTGALLQSQHICQGIRHPEVGVADDEARLVVLHPTDHGRLRLNGLGDIDKGDAALLGQRNAHLLAGHGLHDGGDHGDVHGQGAFLSLLEADHRRFQRHVGGDAVLRGITGHQQIFAEGMGRLLEKIGHSKIPLSHRSFIVLLIINIIFNNIANTRYGQAAMT